MKFIAILLLLSIIIAASAKGSSSDDHYHKGLKKYLDSINGQIQNFFDNRDWEQDGWEAVAEPPSASVYLNGGNGGGFDGAQGSGNHNNGGNGGFDGAQGSGNNGQHNGQFGGNNGHGRSFGGSTQGTHSTQAASTNHASGTQAAATNHASGTQGNQQGNQQGTHSTQAAATNHASGSQGNQQGTHSTQAAATTHASGSQGNQQGTHSTQAAATTHASGSQGNNGNNAQGHNGNNGNNGNNAQGHNGNNGNNGNNGAQGHNGAQGQIHPGVVSGGSGGSGPSGPNRYGEELAWAIYTNKWNGYNKRNVEEKSLGKLQIREEDDDDDEEHKQPTKQEGGERHSDKDHVKPPCHRDNFRVTVVDPIGNVVAQIGGGIYNDNGNGYNSRPEIQTAILKGEGFASRPIGDHFRWYLAKTYFSDDHHSYHITVRISCSAGSN